MTKEEAISIVKESIGRGSSTPCTWRDDRDKYIEEESKKLLQRIIDPVEVHITSESFSYGTLEKFKGIKIYGIARSEKGWLLFNPKLKSFSLAFGKTPSDLEILGFDSNDALTEWLG
jgi:hypothetical protein